MDIKTYSKLAIRTAPDMGKSSDLLHGVLGVGSEAGELLDSVKRNFAYGKPIDETNLKEEVADVMWYLNLIVVRMGFDWTDILASNIRKLEARYPNATFSSESALNRNTEAERAALEGS